MVQVKSIPEQAQLSEALDMAVDAVRCARHMYVAGKLAVVKCDPDLRSAHARRSAVTRLRRELDGYCPCGECASIYADEIAVASAKLALEFRDFRASLRHLQERLTKAKEQVDQAVSILGMHDLLAVCPEQ